MEKFVNEFELIYLAASCPYLIYNEFIRMHLRFINKIISDCTSLNGKCYTYDDVYQEVLVAVWYSFLHYRIDQGMKLTSFLYLVAKSRIFRLLQKHQYSAYGILDRCISLDAPVVGEDDNMSLLDVVADSNALYHPQKIADIDFAMEWLYDFVSDWEEIDVRIVFLRNKGYEYSEIATIVGCRRKHVEYILHKLRKGWHDYSKSNV